MLTAGPERATEAIRKALSMGADKAVHLIDDGLHGSDVVQTGWALARALGTIEGTELVIAGNEATDGVGGAVPAIIAEYLGLPQLTHLRKLTVEGGKVTGERETDDGVFTLEASLPAVVSVTEKINEPRFPSFKGIMAAKKKEVTTLTLAEIGVEADEVGVANAGSTVLSSTPKPPKTAGEKVTDEGEGGTKIAAVPGRPEDHLDRIPRTEQTQKRQNTMAEVLVLVEHAEGALKKVTAELITAARALGEPSAVVVGQARHRRAARSTG